MHEFRVPLVYNGSREGYHPLHIRIPSLMVGVVFGEDVALALISH